MKNSYSILRDIVLTAATIGPLSGCCSPKSESQKSKEYPQSVIKKPVEKKWIQYTRNKRTLSTNPKNTSWQPYIQSWFRATKTSFVDRL